MYSFSANVLWFCFLLSWKLSHRDDLDFSLWSHTSWFRSWKGSSDIPIYILRYYPIGCITWLQTNFRQTPSVTKKQKNIFLSKILEIFKIRRMRLHQGPKKILEKSYLHFIKISNKKKLVRKPDKKSPACLLGLPS